MRKHFSLLPLAMLVTTAVYAENLEIINVVSENTGAKSKTNVITTESINRDDHGGSPLRYFLALQPLCVSSEDESAEWHLFPFPFLDYCALYG